ncbi:MAG TPA: methyltransferase domain-containing protein [Longimicrobiaceae bacterium]|nr:methyltransferase domain-containing protein [Longimicrobiaceae bacterium]
MAKVQARRLSRREQVSLFARNFLKHPRMLGSVIPSSRFLVDRLLRRVDWARARLIVEYGPGVGNFTAEILRRMHPDAKLVVIETNEDFVDYLRQSLPDPRLRVEAGSAADVVEILERMGLGSADYVISGIPFSTMPAELRVSILRATRAALKPDGAFLVYQFSGGVLPDLKRIFGWVQQSFEPLNVLPARLFYCSP